MRDDMYKVIVERPRWGSRMRTRDGRLYRASEDVSSKIGMKQGYRQRKWLNENLSPLQRWLEAQADRPWAKVYSELCANIDRRNTVQEHIFAHIDQFVERETQWIDGKVHAITRWGKKYQPIEESTATLYVHPLTGLLRTNRHRITRKQRVQQEQQAARAALAARRRDISPPEQLHCIDSVWFNVTLAPLGESVWQAGANDQKGEWITPKHWDVLRKRFVSRLDGRAAQDAYEWYGRYHVYAKEKRQLASGELRRHGLTNDNAGTSRRCRLWGVPLRPATFLVPRFSRVSLNRAYLASPRRLRSSSSRACRYSVKNPCIKNRWPRFQGPTKYCGYLL
jgi:hypothetical protein